MSVTVVDNINAAVALSPVGTWFRLEGCGHPKERIGSRFLVSYDKNPCSATLTFPRQKFVLASRPG